MEFQTIYRMRESCDLKHRRYRTLSLRQKALQQTLAEMPSITSRFDLVSVFRAELDALIGKPYFGRFRHTAQIDNIDFDAAFQPSNGTNLL
jgi:hypothetical protein